MKGEEIQENNHKAILSMVKNYAQGKLYQNAIEWAQQRYKFVTPGLQSMKPLHVVELLHQRWRLQRREADDEERNKHRLQTSCREQQFVNWICICYAYQHHKTLEELDQYDTNMLRLTCQYQSASFLRFHLKNLLNEDFCARSESWSPEQIQILSTVVRRNNDSGKWKKIAYELYLESNERFHQSPRSCREMWKNHINPGLAKTKWTLQQDIELFKLICEFGRKWSKVAKLLESQRTDHMVKNRVLSLVNRYSKKKPKLRRLPEEEILKILQSQGSDSQPEPEPEKGRQAVSVAFEQQQIQIYDQDQEQQHKEMKQSCSRPEESEKQPQVPLEKKQQFEWPEFDIHSILKSGSLVDQRLGQPQGQAEFEIEDEREEKSSSYDDYLSWEKEIFNW